LKLFFFFKENEREGQAKEYLLRADYIIRDNQSLPDWLRNLGVGAVPQYSERRKITYSEFIEEALVIVQSLEHRVEIEDPVDAE
jgi:hypothetical protein